MKFLKATLLAGGAMLAAGTASAQQPVKDPDPFVWAKGGLNIADIDKTVRPGDDFNAYVNGKWEKSFEIPPQFPAYGVGYDLYLGAERQVKQIIDEAIAAKAPVGSLQQKVADTYTAYNDVAGINARGLAPAKPWLDRIQGVSSYAELATLFGQPGIPAPFGSGVSIDPGAPTRNTVFVGTGGMGLPDRDNYLVDNDRNKEMRAKYIDYLTFLLGKAGYANPKASAQAVYDLEYRFAQLAWDRALSRNPTLTTNRMDYAGVMAMSNGFPLDNYLKAAGYLPTDTFNVVRVPPTADELAKAGLTKEQAAKLGDGFPGMMKMIPTVPLDTWKAWMTTQFLNNAAAVLPSDIDDANFAFFGQYLQGRKTQRDRWQRSVATTNALLGEAIGKIYVDRHFPPANKAAMEELVGNLRKAMALNIAELPWMTPATKAKAKAKLDAFGVKIGYPSKFKTYDGVTIAADNPLANAIALGEWQRREALDELRKPVDKEKWLMTPQTVNAYYMPPANEIVFPAAYLQSPNFSLSADAAVNYGAIGATIGHEIGHGFDDQGSRYDGTGALNNWWTDEDRATFDKLGARLVEQYGKVCPIDDGKTCINGKLTLGENIGDIGGISIAYRAYKLSLNGKKAPVINGLTGDQRFFLSYAQHWRDKSRPDALRQQMQTDPHSPDFARVNEVVRNVDAWYKAFNVKPTDKLYLPPEQRVRIW